jgi:hypothetical protein
MKWLRCNNAHRVIHKLTFVRDMNDTPAPMIAPFFETTKVTEVSTDSINFVASFRLLVLYCTVVSQSLGLHPIGGSFNKMRCFMCMYMWKVLFTFYVCD